MIYKLPYSVRFCLVWEQNLYPCKGLILWCTRLLPLKEWVDNLAPFYPTIYKIRAKLKKFPDKSFKSAVIGVAQYWCVEQWLESVNCTVIALKLISLTVQLRN